MTGTFTDLQEFKGELGPQLLILFLDGVPNTVVTTPVLSLAGGSLTVNFPIKWNVFIQDEEL